MIIYVESDGGLCHQPGRGISALYDITVSQTACFFSDGFSDRTEKLIHVGNIFVIVADWGNFQTTFVIIYKITVEFLRLNTFINKIQDLVNISNKSLFVVSCFYAIIM